MLDNFENFLTGAPPPEYPFLRSRSAYGLNVSREFPLMVSWKGVSTATGGNPVISKYGSIRELFSRNPTPRLETLCKTSKNAVRSGKSGQKNWYECRSGTDLGLPSCRLGRRRSVTAVVAGDAARPRTRTTKKKVKVDLARALKVAGSRVDASARRPRVRTWPRRTRTEESRPGECGTVSYFPVFPAPVAGRGGQDPRPRLPNRAFSTVDGHRGETLARPLGNGARDAHHHCSFPSRSPRRLPAATPTVTDFYFNRQLLPRFLTLQRRSWHS